MVLKADLRNRLESSKVVVSWGVAQYETGHGFYPHGVHFGIGGSDGGGGRLAGLRYGVKCFHSRPGL